MQLYFFGMCLIYIYISDDNLECLLALNFYMAMFGCQMIVSPVFQIFYFFVCLLLYYAQENMLLQPWQQRFLLFSVKIFTVNGRRVACDWCYNKSHQFNSY